MKKKLFIATTFMLLILTGFSSCKPSISIEGGNVIYQSLPATAGTGTFVAPQGTSSSGTVTVDASNVNPNKKGIYQVTYAVGQEIANLEVHIVNDAEPLAGNYSVHDTIPSISILFLYDQTIVTDSFVNNRMNFVHINGFGDYQNNFNIYANTSGINILSTISLPSQTTGAIGSNSHIHNFVGSGSILSTSPYKFDITYTDTDQTSSTNASGVMTFTHY